MNTSALALVGLLTVAAALPVPQSRKAFPLDAADCADINMQFGDDAVGRAVQFASVPLGRCPRCLPGGQWRGGHRARRRRELFDHGLHRRWRLDCRRSPAGGGRGADRRRRRTSAGPERGAGPKLERSPRRRRSRAREDPGRDLERADRNPWCVRTDHRAFLERTDRSSRCGRERERASAEWPDQRQRPRRGRGHPDRQRSDSRCADRDPLGGPARRPREQRSAGESNCPADTSPASKSCRRIGPRGTAASPPASAAIATGTTGREAFRVGPEPIVVRIATSNGPVSVQER